MVAAIVLAFMAAALVISGQLPSGGGPGTPINQKQPLVQVAFMVRAGLTGHNLS